MEEADYEHIVTRSIALQNLGKFEDSFKMIEKAIATEPNRFEAYHRRGKTSYYERIVEFLFRKDIVSQIRFRIKSQPQSHSHSKLVIPQEM